MTKAEVARRRAILADYEETERLARDADENGWTCSCGAVHVTPEEHRNSPERAKDRARLTEIRSWVKEAEDELARKEAP